MAIKSNRSKQARSARGLNITANLSKPRKLTRGGAPNPAIIKLAVLGRHDNPDIPPHLSDSQTGHWFFRNLLSRGNRDMAKKTQSNTQGSAAKTQAPKSGQAPSKAPIPSKPKGQATGKAPSTKVAGKLGGPTDNRRSNNQKPNPLKMGQAEGSVTVPDTISATKRVTDFSQTQVTITYPQQRDLFGYHVIPTPVGTAGSILRNHFEVNIADEILNALDRTLSAQIATSITTAHLIEYFNTLANAYFTLKSVGNHMNVVRSVGTLRPSLRLRAAQVVDNYDVPFAMTDLAAAMRPHYLPPKVKAWLDNLAMVYYVDETPMCPLFQLQSWEAGYNSSAAFVALLDSQRAAVEAMTNARNIDTGFGKTHFDTPYLTLEKLDFGTTFDDRSTVISQFQKEPMYSNDALDLWSNLPLEATHGLGTVVRHEVATRSTGFPKAVFGKGYTANTNAMTQEYITADAIYQPGFLTPGNVGFVGAGNNFKYVSDVGDDERVNVQLISAIQFGVLARAANLVYETTNTLRILPSGATYVETTMNNVREDTLDVMKVMLGVSA